MLIDTSTSATLVGSLTRGGGIEMHLREILVEARFLRVECREVEDRFMGI